MNKIKVLHTLPDLHIGGVANLLLKLFQNFDNINIEHHLCYFGNNEAMLSQFEKEKVHIHKIPYSGLIPLFSACQKLHALIIRENIQIIHANLFLDRIISGFSSLFLNVPVIISIHTTNSYTHNPSLRNKSLLKFEDILGNLTTCKFIAVSNTVKEIAIKKRAVQKEKIITIHSGVKIPEKINRDIRKSSSFELVSVGRLFDSKKFDHLIKIMKLLKDNNQDVRLTILGDGPLRGKLECLTKDLEIDQYVNFVGFSSNVSSYLKEADIFVTCSTEEGFGLSVVEAMSYSLPVVAYDIPIFKEISDDGYSFLISPTGDYKEFANNIISLIRSPVTYNIYSERSRKRSEEKFDIQQSASQYQEFYINVCK